MMSRTRAAAALPSVIGAGSDFTHTVAVHG
jgi:hypothetical protein